MDRAPGLIALDWGTTSLRAYLLAADAPAVLDERAEAWGITRLPGGDFAAAFEALTGPWRRRWPRLAAVAAGMVGSAHGWVEAPYQECPAGAEELAAGLVSVPGGGLRVVPGVAHWGGRPDVMRGEETQVVGALALHPALAARAWLVLPGTHSKWVRVEDGRVADLTTFMTGELFAVLRDHSVLGRPPGVAQSAPNAAATPGGATAGDGAFARGVAAARASREGLAPLLFATRALALAGRLRPEDAPDYLSGLLIGDELRGALAGRRDAPLALVGDAALCARYDAALRLFGVPDALTVGGAAPAGLWHVARRAGLVAAPHA